MARYQVMITIIIKVSEDAANRGARKIAIGLRYFVGMCPYSQNTYKAVFCIYSPTFKGFR